MRQPKFPMGIIVNTTVKLASVENADYIIDYQITGVVCSVYYDTKTGGTGAPHYVYAMVAGGSVFHTIPELDLSFLGD